MKRTRAVLALALLGLVVGCEPDPAAPRVDTAEVTPAPAFVAPMMGPMAMAHGAVVHHGKNGDIGCGVVDGEGNWFPPDFSLPCKVEIATDSRHLNALIVVEASGVPNPTGKMVFWGPYDPGHDWVASYPELSGPPYPCMLAGTDYDFDNLLFTVNWRAWVTPSGEAKLICHYKDTWAFQWPDGE